MRSSRAIIFVLVFFLFAQFPEKAVAKRPKTVREEKTFARRQKRALKEAEEFFLKGDYRSVVEVCDDIFYLTQRYPSQKRYLGQLYYFAGVTHLKLNNLEKAKLYLGRIISRHKNSRLLPDAYVALAEAYFMDEDYDKAGELLTYYTRTYPRGASAPQAYLRLGQIAQKKGNWEEAKYRFGKVKKDFPLSFEAKLIPSSEEEDFFFAVQMGYFNRLDNAKKLKKRLEKKGYSPYIVEIRSSQSTFYRVKIGKLESKTEARYLVNKLKKQGFDAKVYP